MKKALIIVAALSIFGCKAFQVPKVDPEVEEQNKIEEYKSTYIAMMENGLFSGKTEYLKLSEANYKINHSTAGYRSQAKSENLSYLLASELCYEDGYKYFIILPNNLNAGNNLNGNSSHPESTSLIKCVNDTESNESMIIYETEILIKSISEKYDQVEHMYVRYPDLK